MSKLFRPSWKSARKWIAIALGAMLIALPISGNAGMLSTFASEDMTTNSFPIGDPAASTNNSLGTDETDSTISPDNPPMQNGWLFKVASKKNRIMVQQSMMPSSARALRHADGWYKIGTQEELDDLLAAGLVEIVEENSLVTLLDDDFTLLTNDLDYAATQKTYMELIDQQAAWDLGVDGTGVKVAVIDSGLIPDHEDISHGNVLMGTNYLADQAATNTADTFGHGTFVSSVIAAQTNNSLGMAGIADGVTLLPLRAFPDENAQISDIVEAIGDAVAQNVNIINMSFGTPNHYSSLQEALARAVLEDIILVAAAGNGGTTALMYPAAYPGVIGVGAVDPEGEVAHFSQRNDSVYVTAPGAPVRGAMHDNRTGYETGSGTSYATPIIVGVVAMALQMDASMGIADVKTGLKEWVNDAGTVGYDTSYGHGIINVQKMLNGMMIRTGDVLTITYAVNGGLMPDVALVPTLFTRFSEDIPLPVPTRDGYLFTGWYRSSSFAGEPLSVLHPAEETESLSVYAKWLPGTTKDIASISLRGILASKNSDHSVIYDVALPKGTNPEGLNESDLSISLVAPTAIVVDNSVVWDQELQQWRFIVQGSDLGTVNYTLQVSVSDNSAPSVIPDMGTPSGVAVPTSLDNLTPAIPFEGMLSDWFADTDATDVLTYHVSSVDAIGITSVDETTFTYTPYREEASSTVTFHIYAFDGQFKSPEITLTLQINVLPVSLPTISHSSGVFDLNPFVDAYADIPIQLTLYGQTLHQLMDEDSTPPAVLTTDAFSIQEVVENGPVTTEIVYLDRSWLSTLPTGSKSLSFLFSDNTIRSYELVVLDTFVPATSVTALPSTMTAGTSLALTGTVSPMNATNKTLSWVITSAGAGASLSGNTLTATAAGSINLTAIVSNGIRSGDLETPFTMTVTAPVPTPTPNPGGGGGGSVAPPAPPPAPAPPPPPPPLPPAPIAPPEEELVLFSAGEPVTLTYTQADGVVSLSPQEDSLGKLLDGIGPVSPLELNLSGVVGTESVVLPSSMLSTLAISATPGGINGIRLALPEGSVTLDATALRGLSGRAAAQPLAVSIRRLQASALSPAQQAQVGTQPVFDLSVSLGDTAIHTFTGQITFSLPYLLQPGQQGSGVVIWHLTEDGQLVPLPATYNSVTRRITFTAPHLSLFAIGYDPLQTWNNPFSDVSASGWYHDAIRYVHYQGLFSGTAPTNFSPQADMNRAMFVTVLWRMASEPNLTEPNKAASFLDVPSGQWYSQAVSWAVQAGVAGGVGDGRFAPEHPVTREQIAVMMYQYAQVQGPVRPASVIPASYADTATISTWARTAMQWAVAEGLITGKSGSRLDPGGKATRAEVAAILMRYMKH